MNARKKRMIGLLAGITLSTLASAGPLGVEGDIYVIGKTQVIPGLNSPSVVQYDAATGDLVDTFAFQFVGQFNGLTWGPNGNLYTSLQISNTTWKILEFDGQTGEYIQDVISVSKPGFTIAKGLVFGPDGDLYVGDFFEQTITRYDGTTFLEVAATPVGEIVGTPSGMHFAPNGNLFVLSGGFNSIREYDVSGGGVTYLGDFATIPGATQPQDFTWGPNGNIFVTRGSSGGVAELDGTTGAFLGNFVAPNSSLPTNGLAFDDFGRFIVAVVFPVSRIDSYDAVTGISTGTFISDGFGVPTIISIKQAVASGCSAADLAEPFGQLNFFDVSEFLALFSAEDDAVDFNNDGVWNFFDVSEFLGAFSAGCP